MTEDERQAIRRKAEENMAGQAKYLTEKDFTTIRTLLGDIK